MKKGGGSFILLFLLLFHSFVSPLFAPEKDSGFCLVDAAELDLPDLKALARRANQAARKLEITEGEITYVGRGGDKAIFRITIKGGEKLGIGVSLKEGGELRMEWEAAISPGRVGTTGRIGREKGIKGMAEVAGNPGVVVWNWSETTLDKEIPAFHKLSQSDPFKFIESIQQVADAIDSMHNPVASDAPVRIHRDVKLANIHLSKLPNGDMELSLGDFGFSALGFREKGRPTQWHLAPGLNAEDGTPLYINESRLMGDVSTADDIPAYGKAMAELLVGKEIDQLPMGAAYETTMVPYTIPQIRLPISKIDPKAPPDAALIADYTMHLADSMRDVRELMGESLQFRLQLKGKSNPADYEKIKAHFEAHLFKKYLTSQMKETDEKKRNAAIFFVFRNDALIDQFIASKDFTTDEKKGVLKVMKTAIEKDKLNDTRLNGMMIGTINPYYDKAGFEKAEKEVGKPPPGWRRLLPF